MNTTDFYKKFLQIFFFLPITTFLPLLFATSFLGDFTIWLVTTIGILFHLFAPYTPPEDLIKSKSLDKMSTRLLLLVCCLIYMISIVEYVYVRQHPVSWSVLSWLGVAFAFLGLGLRLWATKVLGVFFTATIQLASDQPIIDAGPYRYLRHPAYLSSMLTALSIPLLFHSLFGLLFFFLGFLPAYLYRIHVEEIALIAQYGNRYVEKMSKSKRLIPFIY